MITYYYGTALDATADHFFHLVNTGSLPRDITFVFPSQRACAFFRRRLAERSVDKPIFAPRICTVSDFVISLTSIKQADRLQLLFELYAVYKEVCGAEAETFDRFVYWGELMLRDFDEIDKFLVDGANILNNSSDLNELKRDVSYLSDEQCEVISSFWREFKERAANLRVGSGAETESLSGSFVSFYASLSKVYRALKEKLYAAGHGYEGMIYRMVAEASSYDLPEESKFVFVGLFALSPAERKILRRLAKVSDRVSFIWDYTGVPHQRDEVDTTCDIYRMLERNKEEFGGIVVCRKKSSLPQIDVISSGGAIAQTRAVKGVLSRMEQTSGVSDPIETVIVPADESLLMPLLSALPVDLPINVTMGYPIQQTQVAALFERWFDLVLDRGLDFTTKHSKWRYSVNRLLSLLSLHILYVADPALDSLVQAIRKQQNYYLSFEGIKGLMGNQDSKLLSRLLSLPDFGADANPGICLLDRVIEIIDTISTSLFRCEQSVAPAQDSPDGDESVEQDRPVDLTIEYLYAYRRLVERLRSLFVENQYSTEPATIIYLLQSLVRTMSIPFEGEPLEGLQVMGLLETRVLQFKKVIILSASEGVLPSKKHTSTLIPFTIRRGYGLSVGETEEHTMAYHFYHLVNNADCVTMIYDSRVDGVGGSGEESRYIKQMDYLYGYDVRRRSLRIDNYLPLPKSIVVEKTEDVLRQLSQYLTFSVDDTDQFRASVPKALSPTVINEYVACPLRFYFHVLKGMSEDEEVGELIESNQFGDLLHQSMQTIYENCCQKGLFSRAFVAIDRQWYDNLLSPKGLTAKAQSIVEGIYRKYFGLSSSEPLEMQAEIVLSQLKQYVLVVLSYDRELAPLSYLASEVELRGQLAVSLIGQGWSSVISPNQMSLANVRLKGTIDRIDLVGDNQIRVVDYKTGGVGSSSSSKTLSPVVLASLFDREVRDRKAFNPYKEAVQTCLYTELVRQQTDKPLLQTPDLSPVVYAMQLMATYGKDYNGSFVFKDDADARAAGQKLESYEQQMPDNASFRDEYIRMLTSCLQEMFDADEPFEQVPIGSSSCSYCPFAAICGR